MIQVSDSAKKQLLHLLESEGQGTSRCIRVTVTSGGCSGLSYKLEFADPAPDDKVFEHGEIKVAVDKKSLLYLVGTTLDYSGGLNGKGFVFNNPNAKRTCGCGESFAV
ncbi:MAG: HesB/IscA family protein [Thermaurantimonas sp.]|uniref:HesB/IscA family protein n=1 Tax=Thermaurantimonas sp. TaxID=2681568 RepID=UPI00391D75AA